MAVWALLSNANLSTPGTAWKRVEAQMLTALYSSGGINADVLTSVRYIPVTFANAGNQAGICLHLYGAMTNLTISLQHWNGSSWDTVTTDVFSAPISGLFYIHYFPLTSYAVTTAGSTWRYAVSATGAGAYLCRTATAGDYFYACVLDASAAGPSSGDTIILTDNTILTFDQTFTFSATNSASIVLCEGATFQWENPPAAAYTLTLGGLLLHSHTTHVQIGTEGAPIANNKLATIAMTGSNVFNSYPWGPSGVLYKLSGTFEIWGAEDNNLSVRVAALASSGQKVITTSVDMSSVWSGGDTVTMFGSDVANVDAATYTIASIVGTTLTLTANLTNTVLAGGAIANLTSATKLGVTITGGSYNGLFGGAYLDYLDVVGVYFNGSRINSIRIYNVVAKSVIRSTVIKCDRNGNTFALVAGSIYSATFQNVVFIGGTTASPNTQFSITGTGFTLIKICAKGSGLTQIAGTLAVNASIITDMVVTNSTGICLSFSGNGNTVSDLMVGGTSGASSEAFRCATVATTYSILRVYRGKYGLYLNGAVENTFSNSYIGSQSAAITNDIYIVTGTYNKCTFLNSYLGTSGIGNILYGALGSRLLFDTYNAGVNDHRSWWVYGKIQSTGDGLTDTTVHTSGTGQFAVRFESTSSVVALAWAFDTPTGNIQNLTMTVAVWCKINNAAYYAGTHQKPRLTINYDNGTIAYAEALATTDWQLLSVTFTPLTTYGQITVTLSTMTDATGSNAYVYFDDFAVLYPAGYKLDLGGMDLWANALPITPPIATVINAADVWQVPASGLTGTGTIGRILNALVTGQYRFDKVGGVEYIKDSAGNVVAQFTVTDSATEVVKV